MTKTKKILFSILGIIIALPVLLVIGIVSFLPSIKLQKDLTIESTPERIERGKYLANHVTVCVDCHSTRDWTKFSGPIVPGTEGKGGELFDQKYGFPGSFYSANITQFNLKNWTDAEIYRAVTSGVGKDNHAFFPIMPFMNYGKMDREDVFSIIAYIKTLKPIENKTPASKPDFPMNIIIRTLPVEAGHQKIPNKSDTLAYGKYLVTASACFDCHTNVNEKAEPLPGMDYAGGREFPIQNGILRSSNITFDKDTGIGGWTKEDFLKKFKSYDPAIHPLAEVSSDTYNSIMPWSMYAGMTEEDLSSVYEFIKTIKPVTNKVEKFTKHK